MLVKEYVDQLIQNRPYKYAYKQTLIRDIKKMGIWDFDILGNEFEMEVLNEVAFPDMSMFTAEGSEEDQGKLDEFKEKKDVTCPECGHIFKV